MKLGAFVTKTGDTVNLGNLTVLIGPNNVGKSQTLREIHEIIVNGSARQSLLIDSLRVERSEAREDLFRGLQVIEDTSYSDRRMVRGITSNLVTGEAVSIEPSFARWLDEDNQEISPHLLGLLGRFKVALLDASLRLSVAASSGAYNPHHGPPTGLLQALFAAGPEIEKLLSDAFRRVFNMDLRLDYSGMTNLTFRVADNFPDVPEDPRKALPVMSQFKELDQQGDGFRSFVGVVLSLLLSEGRIVLLDEPEAFLHPAQARMLGSWVAQYSETGGGQVIVATHNAHFLKGILSQEVVVDVFRLNRSGTVTNFNKISADAIAKLTSSPLLSSQRVLDAFFYKGAVVCEGDADRTIYETVATKEFDNQNVLFLHSQNKQTIGEVVKLLKGAEIEVVAIVDIDILDSQSELQSLLQSSGLADSSVILSLRNQLAKSIEELPEEEILTRLGSDVALLLKQLTEGKHNVAGARSALGRIRADSTRWKSVKDNGIYGFSNGSQGDAVKLIEEAKHAGVWIVPVGELERWIDVDGGNKKTWVIRALEVISNGKCPENLKGFVGEVLTFLGERASQLNGRF